MFFVVVAAVDDTVAVLEGEGRGVHNSVEIVEKYEISHSITTAQFIRLKHKDSRKTFTVKMEHINTITTSTTTTTKAQGGNI